MVDPSFKNSEILPNGDVKVYSYILASKLGQPQQLSQLNYQCTITEFSPESWLARSIDWTTVNSTIDPLILEMMRLAQADTPTPVLATVTPASQLPISRLSTPGRLPSPASVPTLVPIATEVPNQATARLITTADVQGPTAPQMNGKNVTFMGGPAAVPGAPASAHFFWLNDGLGNPLRLELASTTNQYPPSVAGCYQIFGIEHVSTSFYANMAGVQTSPEFYKAYIDVYAWTPYTPPPGTDGGCRTPTPDPVRPDGLPTAHVVSVDGPTTLTVNLNGDTQHIQLLGVAPPAERSAAREDQRACWNSLATHTLETKLAGQDVGLESDPAAANTTPAGQLQRYIWLSDGSLVNYLVLLDGLGIYGDIYYVSTPTVFGPHIRFHQYFANAWVDASKRQVGMWRSTPCVSPG
jgi:endonuclease YncB( thermonuclease family)